MFQTRSIHMQKKIRKKKVRSWQYYRTVSLWRAWFEAIIKKRCWWQQYPINAIKMEQDNGEQFPGMQLYLSPKWFHDELTSFIILIFFQDIVLENLI